MKHTLSLLALTLAGALTLAACDRRPADPAAPTTTDPPPATGTTTSPPPPMPPASAASQ